MLTLSFDALFLKIKNKAVPAQYKLQSPVTIPYTKFFDALACLKNKKDFLYFLDVICSTKDLTIKSTKNSYKIDSWSDFLCLNFEQRFYKDAWSEEINDAVEEKLNNVTFSKQQLISLLKRANPKDLEYCIYDYKCFSEKDLLDIVNDVDIVHSLSLKTLTILYFYFNTERKWKTSITPLLDIYYFTFRVGHILGLKDGLSFEKDGKVFSIDTEGEFAATSLAHLSEYVQLYKDTYPATTLFEKIAEALSLSSSLIVPCRNHYDQEAKNIFHKEYEANQLVYFSSGWSGHIVGIGLYGDYLIYANRGENGAKDTGCRIFKIKDRKLITPEFIRALTSDNLSSAEEFHDILKKMVDLNSPVVSFQSKNQKYDTCSFVNPKAAIEAMIVLLQVGPTAGIEKIKEQFAQESDRQKYKSFTTFVRNTEVDELIKNMFYANNPYLIAFYAELIKQIIYQHYGNDLSRDKDYEELARSCDLYARLPIQVKNLLDEDEDFLQFMEELNSYNKENVPPAPLGADKPIVHQMKLHGTEYKVAVANGNIFAINNVVTPLMHFSEKQAERMVTGILIK